MMTAICVSPALMPSTSIAPGGCSVSVSVTAVTVELPERQRTPDEPVVWTIRTVVAGSAAVGMATRADVVVAGHWMVDP